MATPARPHRRLVWKYVAVVGTLVAAAIVSVGISEFWFSYEDSKRAVTEAEADKASSAAISIRQFIEELGGDLDGVAQPIPGDTGRNGSPAVVQEPVPAPAGDQRADVPGCDRRGVRAAYSNEVDKIDSLTCEGDRSDSEEFRRARAEQRYFGSVTFDQPDGRPHMDIAVAEAPPGERRHRRRRRPRVRRRRDPSGADRHRGLRLRRRCRRPGHRPHHEQQPRPRRHEPRGAAAGARRPGRRRAGPGRRHRRTRSRRGRRC